MNQYSPFGLFQLTTLLTISSLALPAGSACAQQHNPGLAKSDSRYLAQPERPDLPTIFIIGDSTVRNGNGAGGGGQWGWGDFIAPCFDTGKINIVNDALGGTSSRTFYRDRWPGVKAMMKPGDFVIMQFGHNDASPINEEELGPKTRSRGTIDGGGPETQTITNILTERVEVVHSYGWYLQQFVHEARDHGATPIICSLIPRNEWTDEKIRRDTTNYAGWAKQAARSADVAFIDLNGLVADRYQALGPDGVDPLFIAGAGPHTSEAGAKLNASIVASELKDLTNHPLAPYFSSAVETIAPAAPATSEQ